MSGLSNYARHTLLRPLIGLAGIPTLPNGTYVNLLTASPTTDGDSGGGTLTGVGAAEWSLARKIINTEASTTSPYWIRQSGSSGGWEMRVSGTIDWSAVDTGALSADTTIVAVAIYDAVTGGNLWAWAPLDTPLVVAVSAPVQFASTKLGVLLHGELC